MRIDGLRPLISAAFPLGILALWWAGAGMASNNLIPMPVEVGKALWDLAFGGINDDAFIFVKCVS